jgi:uncharacterized protein with HEPN domain
MPLDEPGAARLWDMLEYAREIEQTVGGLTFEHYMRDKTLRLATERRIEIIGEAARNVSRPFQESRPEIPWQKIVAQRHVLAHEYGEVRQEIIYRVATTDIARLIPQLAPLIPPMPPETP